MAWGAVLCGAVRCGAVRCGAVRCGAVRCGAVRCGEARLDFGPTTSQLRTWYIRQTTQFFPRYFLAYLMCVNHQPSILSETGYADQNYDKDTTKIRQVRYYPPSPSVRSGKSCCIILLLQFGHESVAPISESSPRCFERPMP